MAKLGKEFFLDNEVLFMGYSSRNSAFSKKIFRTFTNNGIKVFPVNSKRGGNYDIKVYGDPDEISKLPKTAYILLNRENTAKAVKQLAGKGVKRILFQSNKTVDESVLEECRQKGIETAVACPMMILGSGLHRIHAFFKGVR